MKTLLFGVLITLVLLSQSFVPIASAAPDSLTLGAGGPLEPGVTVTYEQKIPINIVFIGYDQKTVDKDTVLSQLPATYTPVVIRPFVNGYATRDLGLKYTFDYQTTFANHDLTRQFFNYLKQIGTPGDLTNYQGYYNNQEKNVLDVTGPVLYINGPCVEKWLAHNLIKGPGYTIVFVNWYSQPNFQFHVYTKTNEPDLDTGYNFGELKHSRKMIAWGGENHRLWFYDLSAGPEAWTDNWNVDNPDLNGDGHIERRMPPIWEYRADGYRDPALLSYDLGMITRVVGIDLLFTTSPLYDPILTAPAIDGAKVIHISMLEDDPGSSGLDWIKPDIIQDTFAALEPYYHWQIQMTDVNPIDPGAQRAFRIYTGLLNEPDCWSTYEDRMAQLFCYFTANWGTYIPGYGKNDSVAAMFAFNTTTETLGDLNLNFGTGYADMSWIDGSPSHTYGFSTAYYRNEGFGFTNSVIHEMGHHFGLAHPHDGYDAEKGVAFSANGSLYYANSGDESDTVMHYMNLSQGFSKFNRDNLYRWEIAGYLNLANGLLDDVLAHPKAHEERANIILAEKYARKAIADFNAWEYGDGAFSARKAYVLVAKSAEALGVSDAAQTAQFAAPMHPLSIPPDVDTIRFPED